MNALINWIALNNTLLIKIGFSAVILLVIIYVYRFFFLPRISVAEADSSALAKSRSVDLGGGAGATSMSIEELAEMQSEIESLKVKLKEAESATKSASAKPSGEEKPQGAAPAASGGAGDVEMIKEVSSSATTSQAKSSVSDEELNTLKTKEKELSEKVKHLEARLSEYEIIAEDIAEIGKLRQENEQLKQKISSALVAPQVQKVESQVDEAPADEVATTYPIDSTSEVDNSIEDKANAEIDALLGSASVIDDAGSEPVASGPSVNLSQIVITSDIEVGEEEKINLNNFESYLKVKKE